MNDRLDRIEAIVASIVVQQQASSEAINRLSDRLDLLASRIDGLSSPIQNDLEALRVTSRHHDEWLEQMRSTQAEICDIRQEINDHIRDHGRDNE